MFHKSEWVCSGRENVEHSSSYSVSPLCRINCRVSARDTTINPRLLADARLRLRRKAITVTRTMQGEFYKLGNAGEIVSVTRITTDTCVL